VGQQRNVVVVVYDGMSVLDLAGPVEVLAGATGGEHGGYRVRVCSVGGGPVRASAVIGLDSDDLRLVAGPVDLLLVVGGPGYVRAAGDEVLLAELRRVSALAARTASVCTGALVLAAAGLLDGRRATTHWNHCAELAAAHPSVRVVPDAIFVDDGDVLTSAGVTAGVDLALALVERDLGADVARTVARWMVVFLQRSGGQSQFSVRASTPTVRTSVLRDLLDAVTADPAAPWTVATMAARATMSERHLARLFPAEVGTSPGRFVERIRVEAATELLMGGDDCLPTVAHRCGFRSDETMRRAFLRVLGVPPGAYRTRFRTTGAA
jgi:transcriptional regulator GlxA family with amidase domain